MPNSSSMTRIVCTSALAGPILCRLPQDLLGARAVGIDLDSALPDPEDARAAADGVVADLEHGDDAVKLRAQLDEAQHDDILGDAGDAVEREAAERQRGRDRKSTRLNSSHDQISYAVFCL